MIAFNLKKLIDKPDVNELINGLNNSMGVNFCIKDNYGNILYGADCNNMTNRLPIKANSQIVGLVYGQNVNQIAVIASLLNQVIGAEIQIRMMTDETLAKYDELKTLYEFVERFNRLNVKEIANYLIRYVLDRICANNVSVMLINEKTGSLKLIDEYGTPVGALIEIAESLMSSGKADIINDCKSDSRFEKAAGTISSLIYTPIKTNEKTLGIATASTIEPYNYTAADLKLFSTLVFQAAVTIDNARLYKSLEEAVIKMVYTLVDTLEKRDPYTAGHSRRVMNYSVAIAETIGMSCEDKERLKLSSVLHDIGKIGVRDDVLLKKDKLTDADFEHIKLHPTHGAEILSRIEEFEDIIPGIKFHHRYYTDNNRSYPLGGPTGLDIHIFARIIAVADTFDAMTTKRPYREEAKSSYDALEELKKYKGTQFDPKIVDAFLKAWNDNKITLVNQY
ncbi:HD domain-containing phosphohydrolase [Candidatus Magnetominusculus xianensis]|uniref:Phosphohydrolase n=1 Tax=Candidatus Magnetominusculus xianensis TaxID=1748249 RepID=A0ABR5SCP1_9BACT|nr:HD domain-containing phosphohydrolase [Candidatus Magnetominusculus xianensis]KWT81177.1 phosphohydrolase [Candidatus Magnetominusculus xianensis]MBF0404309.1 HD domain-containing protein [Nitrospirota bacterium]